MAIANFLLGTVFGFVLFAIVWRFRNRPVLRSLTSNSIAKDDTGDVLQDADRRMAYGFYAEAASLIERQIEREPGRADLKLKLLEVLFVWGDKSRFLDKSKQFKPALEDTSEWRKVATMGANLCPGDAMFRQDT